MKSSSHSPMVIDASAAIWAVVPGPVDPMPIFKGLVGAAWWAPEIWLPEVISAIRSMRYAKVLTDEEAEQAVKDIFLLDVSIFPTDEPMALAALSWAERLQQRRAYDALYVALAERLNAPLWSADRRLVEGLRQLGVSWAHWIGDVVDVSHQSSE